MRFKSNSNSSGNLKCHYFGWAPQTILFAVCAAAFADKPNIVVILADDMGYGDISAYDGWIETPHLDRIAANGARFVDFHSNGAVCSPTRAALVTGKYQQRVGIPSVVVARKDAPTHRDGIREHHTTFGELMRDAGYRTALFGKWHLGYYPKNNPTLHGFDQFRGYISGNVDFFSHVDQVGRLDWWNGRALENEPGYTTHLITKHSLDFLDANRDHPFCMYVAHEAPHYPYQGPNDKPERVVGKNATPSHGSRKDKRVAYREMVGELDNGIGQIVDRLESLGIAERTFVFFFSDNGATAVGSCGPLRGNKGSIWEGGHRVPAIAYWPGKIESRVVLDTAIGMDLVPTMLKLGAGSIADSHNLDGVDLSGMLQRGDSLPQRNLYWDLGGKGSAVRQDRWKLVRSKTKPNVVKLQLFDLQADVGEQTNLIDQHPDIADRLTKDLTAWRKEVGVK